MEVKGGARRHITPPVSQADTRGCFTHGRSIRASAEILRAVPEMVQLREVMGRESATCVGQRGYFCFRKGLKNIHIIYYIIILVFGAAADVKFGQKPFCYRLMACMRVSSVLENQKFREFPSGLQIRKLLSQWLQCAILLIILSRR
ncbi:hypothetical protein GBF38_013789 [Nibea albiflora]|uniref:Uncharacterized protein n=1 Tax=Nibea albiflora TaxID=240163 RepID=A0ACB7F6W8_NIBAL|nr:hypothetical protein GBF38_013789 [Nibea albiflora]